ncbi:hypothetical protein AB0425_17795 [Actinosynnema sp. NPDC051121]
MNITLAEVHVDLGNTSCVVSDAEHQYGQWAPGVTRRVVDEVIAADGWRCVPGSGWTSTVDGGTRPVFRADDEGQTESVLIDAEDALLDALAGRDTEFAQALGQGDELCALFLAIRADGDRPAPQLVSTEDAVRAITAARERRFRRVHLSLAGAVGAAGVLITVLLDSTVLETALAFPAGALSYLLGYALPERLFGRAR